MTAEGGGQSSTPVPTDFDEFSANLQRDSRRFSKNKREAESSRKYLLFFRFFKLGKLCVAILTDKATAKASFAAVDRAGAAATHYEIVHVLRFDNVAAKVALDYVLKYFLQISPVPFLQQFLPKP